MTSSDTQHQPNSLQCPATVMWTVNDGFNDSTRQVTTILTDVNEVPVLTVPGTLQQSDATGAVVFNLANGNLISVADDSGSASIKVTLTATNGTMTLNGIAGLNFDSWSGDGIGDADHDL